MTPDYFASADTYSLYKAYVQILVVKLTEQCQSHTQDKPRTNVGMSHPTRLFWAVLARFDCIDFIAPVIKIFFSFILTM
jgi:hypothetical protein